MSSLFSFELSTDFVDGYRTRPVAWGFADVAGNSFSELTFLDKYSRLKDDGSKETWADVCQRVVNGTYSIQKDHAKANRLACADRAPSPDVRLVAQRHTSFSLLPGGCPCRW